MVEVMEQAQSQQRLALNSLQAVYTGQFDGLMKLLFGCWSLTEPGEVGGQRGLGDDLQVNHAQPGTQADDLALGSDGLRAPAFLHR